MQRPWFDSERFHGRLFEKGDLKYVILQLLSERPAHGYEVIRALEERFGGYTPSAGAVYPTLQMLEDMEYVTSEQQGGKKVYSITDEGRRFLEEQKEVVEGIRQRTSSWWSNPHLRDEMHEMKHEMQDFARTMRHRGKAFTNPETIRRIREVIGRAHREIEDILRESNPPEPEKESAKTSDTL